LVQADPASVRDAGVVLIRNDLLARAGGLFLVGC
jgi:hypothetical protein